MDLWAFQESISVCVHHLGHGKVRLTFEGRSLTPRAMPHKLQNIQFSSPKQINPWGDSEAPEADMWSVPHSALLALLPRNIDLKKKKKNC